MYLAGERGPEWRVSTHFGWSLRHWREYVCCLVRRHAYKLGWWSGSKCIYCGYDRWLPAQ